MPRAIDPSLSGGGLPITHSPLNRLQHNVIPRPYDIEKLLHEIIDGFANQVRDYIFPAITELTGIDLSVFLPLLNLLELDFSSPEAFLTSLFGAIMAVPGALLEVVDGVIAQIGDATGVDLTEFLALFANLDLSSPAAFIASLAEALVAAGTALLSSDSALNALNLYNLVPTDLLAQFSASNIGTQVTNLIADPDFLDPTEIEGWLHNPTGGFGGTGSRSVVADGATHELLGNLIPVSEGQVLPLKAKAKWTGLAGSGNPIALAITGYTDTGASVQQMIASHNTIPPTTDWVDLAGSYTVPTNVTSLRTRLAVGPSATAGTVSFSKTSATKVGPMLQRLMAGTNPDEFLPDDITHLFSGITSNALALVNKVEQQAYNDLTAVLGGTLPQIDARLKAFLNGSSPLDAGKINTGNVADQFVPGLTTIRDSLVTAVGNLSGSGFDITKVIEVLTGQSLSVVDHGAGITNLFSRLSNLESKVSALPVAAGGTGQGTAAGGAVGVSDIDNFERVSSTNLGPDWLTYYQGGSGIWSIPNGHDATFAPSGTSDREFLCIRNRSDILRSATDYQRVTKELSSKATRYYDLLLGTFNYVGHNDVWLRISDTTTSLANVTGIRVRFGGDGSVSIVRFVNGNPTTLKSLGVGSITPPGPGANIIGEAGVLADGAVRTFRAKIGASIRLEVSETGTASGLGAAFRRWGHGGRAEGHLLPLPGQESPGGAHYFNAMDQTL